MAAERRQERMTSEPKDPLMCSTVLAEKGEQMTESTSRQIFVITSHSKVVAPGERTVDIDMKVIRTYCEEKDIVLESRVIAGTENCLTIAEKHSTDRNPKEITTLPIEKGTERERDTTERDVRERDRERERERERDRDRGRERGKDQTSTVRGKDTVMSLAAVRDPTVPSPGMSLAAVRDENASSTGVENENMVLDDENIKIDDVNIQMDDGSMQIDGGRADVGVEEVDNNGQMDEGSGRKGGNREGTMVGEVDEVQEVTKNGEEKTGRTQRVFEYRTRSKGAISKDQKDIARSKDQKAVECVKKPDSASQSSLKDTRLSAGFDGDMMIEAGALCRRHERSG
jgi:hypothetical protein